MQLKHFFFTSVALLFLFNCSGPRQFMYQRDLPHRVKWIAVPEPDSKTIPTTISADYLQKMLAYMLFHEKPYFVQPLATTNRILNTIDFAKSPPTTLGRKLKVNGILRYDFFDDLKEEDKIIGFIFSISLFDCDQGRIVWQAIREYRGKANQKSYQGLKQYMQSKVKEESNMPYFAELYETLKDALQSLKAPDFTDDELTERLMNTTEPF